MLKWTILAIMLLLGVAGCAAYRTELDGNPPFSAHHYRHYDVAIEWHAVRHEGGIGISGTITNLRLFYLWNLELSARLLDEGGRVFARETYIDFPTYLPPGQSAQFRLDFKLPPGTRTERVHFTYNYWLAEEAPALRANEAPKFGSFVSPL